jgi:hypothetical protein
MEYGGICCGIKSYFIRCNVCKKDFPSYKNGFSLKYIIHKLGEKK